MKKYTKSIIDKLKAFIVANGLEFGSKDSGLNGNCIVLAGYCVYLELDYADCLLAFNEEHADYVVMEKEFSKCFSCATTYSYGAFWKTEEAHKMYIFDTEPTSKPLGDL